MQSNDLIASPPDFSHVRPLLLAMARERTAERVVELVAERLAEVRNIALARVWLARPLRPCLACGARAEAPSAAWLDEGDPGPPPSPAAGSAASDLHLVAAAADPALVLADLDRRRTPRRDRSAAAAASGLVLDASELAASSEWAWAAALGCRGVVSQPLVFRSQKLGALEVATWPAVAHGGPEWLRVLADHTAAAVANGTAFAAIEELRRRLAAENVDLRRRLQALGPESRLVGEASALRRALHEVALAGPSDATVLVLGESGTGKELVATELHRLSARAAKPLVKVNCASIPRDLYESEFFGHVRGAFTGAQRDRVGRFELADGGTLFLDEIGELPLEVQAKLLRVLQDGTYEKVGDERTRQVDVRLVAATNRDLEAEVAAGRFREDLYYRICVVPIRLPALRDRLEDVPRLAEHLLERACARFGRPRPRLGDAALAELLAHPWPGNVRELANAIERAVILAANDAPGELSFVFLRGATPPGESTPLPSPSLGTGRVLKASEIERIELENLRRALATANGKVAGPGGAAELLGLNPNTLSSRLRRLEARNGRDAREAAV